MFKFIKDWLCDDVNTASVIFEEEVTYSEKRVKDIEFDKNKESILILDDNEGMVSFLLDDLNFFNKSGQLNLDDYNVLTFSGYNAGFDFETTQEFHEGLNIKYAIIDITLGGSNMTKDGNIIYTGVDVFEMIQKYQDDFKFIFYTGNNMNTHIKANVRIMDHFKTLTSHNIIDYILYKTSMDMDTRRVNIFNKLFK